MFASRPAPPRLGPRPRRSRLAVFLLVALTPASAALAEDLRGNPAFQHGQLVRTYATFGHFDEARAALAKAAELAAEDDRSARGPFEELYQAQIALHFLRFGLPAEARETLKAIDRAGGRLPREVRLPRGGAGLDPISTLVVERKYDEALAALEKSPPAAKELNGDQRLAELRARLSTQLGYGRFKDAATTLDAFAALPNAPAPADTAEFHGAVAPQLVAVERYEDALGHFNKAAQLTDGLAAKAQALQGTARCLILLKRFDEAVAAGLEAFAVNDSLPGRRAILCLIINPLALKDPARTREMLAACLEQAADNSEEASRFSFFVAAALDAPEARAKVLEILEGLSAERPNADLLRAAILARNPTEALQAILLLEKLHRECPADPDVLRQLVLTCGNLQLYDKAADHGRRWLDLLKDPGSAAVQVSNYLLKAERPDEAVRLLRETFQKHPESTGVAWALANILRDRKIKGELLPLAETVAASKVDPGQKGALLQFLAGTARALEAPEVAVAVCERALKLEELKPFHERAVQMIESIEKERKK